MKSEFNALHLTLAHRLLDYVRAGHLPAGHHLTEQSLAQALGASRSPVRAALAYLAEKGIVGAQPPRRGVFLLKGADELGVVEHELGASQDDEVYLQLARDKLSGSWGETLSENDAMRRYGLTRERLRRILARAANEGWMEQRASKGWSFLPMIDGPQACAESYALRQMLEPAAMLLPDFAIDSAVLQRVRLQQQALADGGWRHAGHAEMYQANATFHEALASLSGNRFIAQTVTRQNQLRRLLEYQETIDRDRIRRQCLEHLAILDLLERGERAQAAELLARHLGNASQEKVQQLQRAAR
ncbi:MAG TPA: GntR family transcriptional regulator [Alcaligenes sp.]|nr:GntR family transcriptional regulator [Alcaligenes sp.]HRL26614.1 GntR family transcriptional regulator [Alcaligenes sp.]